MDLASLKEEALAETARYFHETQGTLPDQNSDEWEAAYRRYFDLVRKRRAAMPKAAPNARANPGAANSGAANPGAPAQQQPSKLPELSGPSAQARWAATVRDDRLQEIQNKELRGWLVKSWTAAKLWIDTRDMPAAAFLRRVEVECGAHRRRTDKEAGQSQADQTSKAAAAASVRDQISKAGITAEGLVGLLDVSPRAKTFAIKAKLAELSVADRSLRIFEAAEPVLVVIENGPSGRLEYAVERDEGLAADLKLFALSEGA